MVVLRPGAPGCRATLDPSEECPIAGAAAPLMARRHLRATYPGRARRGVASQSMDKPPDARSMPRAALQAERAQVLGELAGIVVEGPGQMTYGSQAAAATHVFEQQRDLALRDRDQQHLAADRCGDRPSRRGYLRPMRVVRQPDRRGAARGAAVGRAVHRLPAQRAPPVTARRARRSTRPGIDLPEGATHRTRAAPRPRRPRRDPCRGRDAAGIALQHAARPVRRPARRPVAQGRVAAADRRVQDPRRLQRRGVAVAGRTRPRPDHLLVGQPRPGRRPGRAPARASRRRS